MRDSAGLTPAYPKSPCQICNSVTKPTLSHPQPGVKSGQRGRSRPPLSHQEAGKTVTFKPGDCHVMLFGLTRDLEFGVNFEFTLQFAKAGHVTLTAEVSE